MNYLHGVLQNDLSQLKSNKMKKEILYNSFAELINSEWLNDRAESHLDCWKDRYYRKSKKDIAFDLSVNHDDSCEIEIAQEDLGRELTDKERDILISKFHKAVLNNLYK